jgi:patatin-like phospholipase/acyl hydrolase
LFRYFLNDALLGWLFSKVNSPQPEIRLMALEQSKKSYLNYLELTKSYNLHTYDLTKYQSQTDPLSVDNILERNRQQQQQQQSQAAFDASLVNSAQDRNEKIRRYKEQKQFENKMKTMHEFIETEKAKQTSKQIDEEYLKEFYMTNLRYWINRSLDDIKLLDGKNQI